MNRLLNAMEPGTYLRPHRHLNPDKDEIFLLLRGRVVLFQFDDFGHISDHLVLDPKLGVYGAEVKAGIWHVLKFLLFSTAKIHFYFVLLLVCIIFTPKVKISGTSA